METSLADVSHAPPSATRMAPVTKEEAGLAKKRVQWAISVLLPARCKGMDWNAPAASPLGPPEALKEREKKHAQILTLLYRTSVVPNVFFG